MGPAKTKSPFESCLLIIVFLYHYFNVSLYKCTRVSILYSDSVSCFHSIRIPPSLCDRYFPRHFVPLPVQAGGRCSHGPVFPSDVCGHRLHGFLQGLEPRPLLDKADRWATFLPKTGRPVNIISAEPNPCCAALPKCALYIFGRTLHIGV